MKRLFAFFASAFHGLIGEISSVNEFSVRIPRLPSVSILEIHAHFFLKIGHPPNSTLSLKWLTDLLHPARHELCRSPLCMSFR